MLKYATNQKHSMTKTIQNLSINYIKSFTIEHPRTSCKLPKTIRQAKKVSQAGGTGNNSTSFYIVQKQKLIFFWMKKGKRKTAK